MRAVVEFLRREDGVTAAEYAVAVGLAVLAVAAVVGVMNAGAAQTLSGVSTVVGTYGD